MARARDSEAVTRCSSVNEVRPSRPSRDSTVSSSPKYDGRRYVTRISARISDSSAPWVTSANGSPVAASQ